MDSASYTFKSLEDKYGGFAAPSVAIKIGGRQIDSATTPVSSLTVDLDAGQGAGGCRFTLESQYDYESSRWDSDIIEAVEVGKTLEIEAGYVSRKRVFYGFVDDYTLDYSADSAPRITVNGIDAKGILMNTVDFEFMNDRAASAVVNSILDTCIKYKYATKKTVGELPTYKAQLIKENQSDYAFLCYLAGLFSVQFFVVDGEVVFKNVLGDTQPVITLNMGVSLLNFSKKLSLRQQVGKVTVVKKKENDQEETIKGEVISSTLRGTGKEAGDKVTGIDGSEVTVESGFVNDTNECKQLAQAIFNERSLNFVSGQGRCVGIPEMIPGRYIELAGLDDHSDDKYYISKVTHEYSADGGYYTTFFVKGAKSK
jgi:phage protein D